MSDDIKIFKYKVGVFGVQVNLWLKHGLKITIFDSKICPFVNIADKNKIIELRDMLNELIESMN